MEHQAENFHQQIRDIIPDLKAARVNVFKKEVMLKKVFYIELVKAKDEGERTYNAQKAKAESTEEYYKASLEVAVAKADYDSCQAKMKAADMEFEEWRTKMANLRSERSRYGA